MMYLKAAAAGAVISVIAGFLWAVGNLELPLWIAELTSWLRPDVGVWTATGYVSSGSTLLMMLIGFCAGFAWTIRRIHRRARTESGVRAR